MENITEFLSSIVAKVNKNPHAIRHLLKIAAIYAVIYIIFIFAVSYFEITQEGIQNYFSKFGLFSIVIFCATISLVALTPLPDTPIVAAGIIIFGIELGFLVIWFSLTVSAMINFTVSKKFGRDFVAKNFPGVTKYADSFAKHSGVEAIIVARIFTFVTFDAVSYAAGLTSMTFKQYFFAAVVSILPIAINYTFVGAGIASRNIYTTILAFTGSVAFALALGYVARFARKRYFPEDIQATPESKEA